MAVHQKIVNTEAKIKSAFIFLVNQNGLEKLNVKNITTYARINRSTFYAHYVDKFELIERYESQILTDIQAILRNNLTNTMRYQDPKTNNLQIYPIFNLVLNYIYDQFDLIKALLGPKGDPQLEVQIKQMLLEVINADLYHVKGTTKMTPLIPNSYAHEIVLAGLFDIVKFWLSQSEPDTPQQVADIIARTRFMSPYDLLGIESKR
ncbi:TetR family transcriptional regulator [Lentilactobacillus fungorum]|uniref:TetR family transcriptional regulator n=1 Tax=Lentilactobacillus fungorum TaxID=2201250 RepID=A0ABQ3W0P9_9LACO|nr:TetR-like C-terminal domain-containing protein [Lentilactobacillus fungorum]GHP14041.1 TetR family transcriptional regulator [Lentilactobacillus fungorum]